MSDIARVSGLQQSSLYYWFRNKEQLLQETPAGQPGTAEVHR